MKRSAVTLFALAVLVAGARADSLYRVGDETQKNLPLKWSVGLDFEWDDNVTPNIPVGHPGYRDQVMSVYPVVGLSFLNNSPQTTLEFFGRIGMLYYFDAPAAQGAKDLYPQGRLGVNFTHQFSDRLRFSSRNFVSYELEPDYSYGYANSRGSNPYLYWSTDNSIGYRWSERIATYDGITLNGFHPDSGSGIANGDSFTWTVYNQFRFQASPLSVLTLEYRYAQTNSNGAAADSTDQYILAGIEHRFSPNAIGILRVGAQLRQLDSAYGAAGTSTNSSSPYLEMAFHSQLNDQLSVRAFTRYGMENYGTIFLPIEYTQTKVLRVGLNAEYALSPTLSLSAGADYITTLYDGGRNVNTGLSAASSPSEDILNLSLGLTYKITDYLLLTATYNYTKSSSDLANHDYNRNRVMVGVRAEF